MPRLQPLLDEIESLSERIREYNERVQQIARESYPEVARLEQVKGVGTLIALTYVLTHPPDTLAGGFSFFGHRQEPLEVRNRTRQGGPFCRK